LASEWDLIATMLPDMLRALVPSDVTGHPKHFAKTSSIDLKEKIGWFYSIFSGRF
jgi:hypothetical protein